MSRRPSRRAVLALGGAAAGGTALPLSQARAGASTSVMLFDPAEPAARAFAAAQAAHGARALPLEADRVQIAQLVFGRHRPAQVAGMTRYADYLVLTDSAREHGYGPARVERQPGDLFLWSLELKRG